MAHLGTGRSGATTGVAGAPGPTLLGSLRHGWASYVILACALLLTLGAWRYARRAVEAEEEERFGRRVALSREAIDRQLDTYVEILLGLRALFAGSQVVERDEFRSYVAALDLPGRYPSIRGVGWTPRVLAAARAPHEAAMRRQGLPRYAIHPDGARSEYFPAAYLEPSTEFPELLYGLDAGVRPEFERALERARDSGLASVSETLTLRRDGQAGLLIFLPVYRGGQVPPTVAARRRALEGFVAASFRPDLMMGGLFNRPAAQHVAIELRDARDPSAPPPAAPPRLIRTLPLEFGGHAWVLRFTALPSFHSRPGRLAPRWVLGSGLLVSVLAFVIALLQNRALMRARQLGADLHAAERRLRQANERFELAAAAVSSAIYDWSIPHGTVVWTPGPTALAGYRLDEVPSTREWWMERVHPEDRARVRAAVDTGPGVGRDFVAEYRFRARDGHYLEVQDRGRVVPDGTGQPARMVGSLIDISERKRAEAVLRASEARHRAVLESAMDAFVGMDHEGRVTEFNLAAEAMFGRTRADVLGRDLASVIIPRSYRDAHRRALARYLATGQSSILGARVEVTGLRADGSEFPVELTVTRTRVEGSPTFNAYIRDLTEQKRAESARASLEMQLQQAQKMEAVGRLAGGVAHDFNNMLTVITGRAHMLLSRLKPGEPLHRDVELVQKTAQRAVALTSQLLAFSRKQVVQPRVLELGPLVAETAPMLQRMIGEDIELIVEPAEGSGRVKVDPGHIQQVLMNLAVNARDAMPEGGRVTVSIRAVEVSAVTAVSQANLPPGPYVVLTVSDTGSGMSPETAAHIFEPFFTTKEHGKGTGLGLSTVYGIVEQSRGHIEVRSELGHGATFTIYLPRVEEPVAGTSGDPGRRLRTTARTVLVVDDEPEVLDLASELLRRVGYSVLQAGDGPAALETARRHAGEIHLLLTDMVMPGMSGRDLAERMRALRPDLRVLYVSGFVQDEGTRATLASEHSAFVAKPFTPELLVDRVRELLASAETEAG